jgi:hypothetical protein
MTQTIAYLILAGLMLVAYAVGRLTRRKPVENTDAEIERRAEFRLQLENQRRLHDVVHPINHDERLRGADDVLLYDLRALAEAIRARTGWDDRPTEAYLADPDFQLLEKGLEFLKAHKKWRDRDAVHRVRKRLALEGLVKGEPAMTNRVPA